MHSFYIVGKPNIDLNALTSLFSTATGKNLKDTPDMRSSIYPDDRKLAYCLSEILGEPQTSTLPVCLSHLHFSGILACDDHVMVDVLRAGSNLAYVGCVGKHPGLVIGLISGNLNAWRDAVVSGLASESTRDIFVDVYQAFKGLSYGSAWSAYKETMDTRGFTLEMRK